MSRAATSFDLNRLREGLRPFRLYWFSRLRSTNDHAATLRKRGELFAPAVVLTSRQTAGRGRGSNTWFSTAGSLTVTFALPIEEHLRPEQISLVGGLAVRNALAEVCGEDRIALKWPNDVVVDDLKLAGVLCERVERLDLVGIGVNVNVDARRIPRELSARITTLAAIAGRPVDSSDCLLTIARRLREMSLRRRGHPFAALVKEYDRYHALVGRRLRVRQRPESGSVEGECEGVDQQGRLLVRSGGTLHRIASGHVEGVL
jgi:BirA family transcriptional regulator, biotin operon repressor / biotin---[acetyl-CoA-carboxylase] ligase